MLIKSHPHLVLPGMAVALVALLALMSVPTDAATPRAMGFRSITGMYGDDTVYGDYETVRIRPHQTFSSGLCPNPRYPVPVLRTEATTGTGKVVIQSCVSGDEPIAASRGTFAGSLHRKRQVNSPYAHVFRVLN